MNAYNPSSPSFITINRGGEISSSTSIGINITHSSLSNGLSNSAAINSSSSTGIAISSTSSINGGISNSGTISTYNIGIGISQSSIEDGISNSGTINASNGTGIKIFNTSTISGGISNTGLITADIDFDGLVIANSIINDGIFNSGSILATASGNAIAIISSTLNNGISNSGTISSVSSTGIQILNISTINGNISNSGLISGSDGLSIHNLSTVNGDISNNGTISGTQKGISIFSETTVGSISNSGTIRGDTFAINISNSDVSDINILGLNARVIGAVDAFNTNVNITSGAIFTSEGSYSVNNFNIATNAIFNMANSIAAITGVNNAGTLSVASNSSQTITGTYTQSTEGQFQTGISSTTSYGQLNVDGTVDLSQSGNIVVQVEQGSLIHAGDVFTNVLAGATLVTATNGFQVSDNSFILEFTANLNPSLLGVDLTAAINPEVYEACQDNYCQGAANIIIEQIIAKNSLFNSYTLLSSESAFQTAASQATPELTNGNIQAIQLITSAVADAVPMAGTSHGKSAGDAMLYQPGKVWMKPYGASMTQNENNSVNGFNATAYGVVIGRDTQLAEDWLVGGAFAAGKDNMHGKSSLSGQSVYSNAYQGILYGAKKFPHDLYFSGQALVGYENNDSSRSIPLYASTAQGSYNSWFTNINAELGWSTYALTQNLVLTPRVDASYLFINQGSYQESGSPMDLSVDSNNNSSLILGAYGDGAYHLTTLRNHYDLTLTGYGGIAGDVINSQAQTTATFVAGGPSFSTLGVQTNGIVFRGGAGLACTNKTEPFSISFNYDLQTGNNAYSGIGSATIKYEF